MQPQLNIAELISACVRGEGQAQKQFYELFLPYVFTIARRFGIDNSDIKDVVQEIFVEIFLQLSKYDAERGELKTWVSTLAKRKLLNFQRTHQRRTAKLANFQLQPTPVKQQPQAPVALSMEHLQARIHELPDGYRKVFQMKEIDGYSHQEIAQSLGISVSSSRSQLTRAKAQLRALLKKTDCYDHL